MPSRTLIKGGTVIDTDTDLVPPLGGPADVLVEDGRIAAVEADLAAAAAVPGTEVIDAAGRIVLPGFVDTHRHTWQAGLRSITPDITLAGYLRRILGELGPRYRPSDVYEGNLAGALECLDAGITTLVDWSHIQRTPAHTESAVEALRAAGIRAVFGYAYPLDRPAEDMAAEVARVRDRHFTGSSGSGGSGDSSGPSDSSDSSDSSGALSMALAAWGPEIAEDRAAAEWRLARELDLPITVHTGGHDAESAERGLAFLERHGLLGPRTTYVHANRYTDEALKKIAGSGGTISVSPIIEAELGIGYPISGRARAAGIPTALGADTVTSGPGDMFSQMRTAYAMERARPDGAGMGFTAADALRMATIEGAEVAGLADVTGSLRPGKQADLIVLRTDLLAVAPGHDPAAAVVLAADTRSVDTVLVGGRIVKRDGALLHHDLPAVLDSLASSAAYVAATGGDAAR